MPQVHFQGAVLPQEAFAQMERCKVRQERILGYTVGNGIEKSLVLLHELEVFWDHTTSGHTFYTKFQKETRVT